MVWFVLYPLTKCFDLIMQAWFPFFDPPHKVGFAQVFNLLGRALGLQQPVPGWRREASAALHCQSWKMYRRQICPAANCETSFTPQFQCVYTLAINLLLFLQLWELQHAAAAASCPTSAIVRQTLEIRQTLTHLEPSNTQIIFVQNGKCICQNKTDLSNLTSS